MKNDRHPCPSCGSSDGVAKYEDGSSYCFSCKDYTPAKGKSGTGKISLSSIATLPHAALPDRGITQETAELFGVRVEYDQSNGEPLAFYFPYYKGGQIVAYKKRGAKEKTWTVIGDIKGAELFGAQRVGSGGKLLVITEGEMDALAATQMLRKVGKHYKVVSLPNGANVKSLKENLEWLEKFETIMLNFDGDEVGIECANKAVEILSVGKVKLVNLGEYKDANDVLRAESPSYYLNALNQSKEWRPDGVVALSEQFSALLSYDDARSITYPWAGLDRLTYGLREREICLITAGSGVGKSAVVRELEHHILTTTEDNIGILALEESTARTMYGLMSVEANQPLHLKEVREEVDKEELKGLFDKLFSSNRVFAYDHFGSTDENSLLSRIRYMIKSLDCKWVILDHISIAVSGIATDDERRLIDRLMTKLRQIVEETGVGMVVVSHLKRIEGNRGHEDGATVRLSHLRGSASFAQLSDTVIALERDQSQSDMELVNRTSVRVLKNRYSGGTGLACELQYNPLTGRLSEVEVDI